MKKVTLKIESGYIRESISLDDEITIGRAAPADLVLEDVGLSQINTAIFRDGEDVLIVDENSTNGTFLNGEKISSRPKILFDGDEIKLGSETRVSVQFGEKSSSDDVPVKEKPKKKPANASTISPTVHNVPSGKSAPPKEKPIILMVAAGSTMAILLLAGLGIILANYLDLDDTEVGKKPKKEVNVKNTIPVRVIDPFGGKEQEDLAELTQYFEVQEEEIKVGDLEEIAATTTPGVPGNPNLPTINYNVSIEFFKKQYASTRVKVFGDPGIGTPRELCCGVPKQKAKIREMQQRGYQLPMDFADLARKRMSGELLELPMATAYWVLDVGGSSTTAEFTNFDFQTGVKTLQPGSQDYNDLARLASNFSGVKYDLNNPTHRRQMKIRLLRMFHPSAKPILEKIAKAYQQKFNRPLRVTSLSRSMEYQIGLNKINPNSFKVRGAGSLPPHTSGCAFDLSRKFMSKEEHQFMYEILQQMETAGQIDGLKEGGNNMCFHIFIYNDGRPPA